MLERIRLQNFKACRDIAPRLGNLTLLAGLNSSGKSSLLQAICGLRQSYDANGNTTGMCLSGHLVQLGRFRDVLSEDTSEDEVAITIQEQGIEYRWVFKGPSDVSQLQFAEAPRELPAFLTSCNLQFLNADRATPQTLYPQADQREGEVGFLGVRGEYTAGFLEKESLYPVPKRRTFPRSGIGLTEDLLKKVAPTDRLLDQVAGWLQQLSPGSRISTTSLSGTDEVLLQFRYDGRAKETTTNFYRPTNVGFGLTFCLPIIVSCLAARQDALLLLENPEAHLHPQGQAALGELIARAASDGVQIIVETHSDHLLNGVRLAVKRQLIDPNDVALHFFTRSVSSGEAFIQSPAILDDGRLSNWPLGFFDQWDKDVDALLG